MNRTVLLVGGLEKHIVKAQALGLRVILLQHPTKVTAEQEALADELVIVDFTDWSVVEPLVAEHFERWDFGHALSLTEPGVENAARINDRYGLGGTTHAVTARMRDKLAMRRHVAATDPAAVPATTLDVRADLDAFAARHGYPFVVKPTNATASFGVFRVDDAAGAERVWAAVEQLRGRTTDRGTTLFKIQDFLIEEYVDGREYSVESFSFGGRHVIVAITEKYVDEASFTEVGHAMPARLEPDVETAVRARVAHFFDSIGLADGVCHTEIRIGRRGPAIIESHNRAGGDAISDLVFGAYGIDLLTLAVGWPFGLVDELPDRPVALRGASTRFLVGRPGVVASVSGVEEASADPRVLTLKVTAHVGDTVRTLRDNWDRVGMVAVTGADTADAVAYGAQVIAETLHVRIRAEDGTTFLAEVVPVDEGVRSLETV
jgi:biotin carboxylase